MSPPMSEDDVKQLIDQFNRAWNEHDLEAALALVSDNCVFEATSAPDGKRFEGKDAVRRAWMPIFDNPNSHFDVEDFFVAGDRFIQRWHYQWGEGHVRGVDLIRVANGKVTEKLSYVKG